MRPRFPSAISRESPIDRFSTRPQPIWKRHTVLDLLGARDAKRTT